MIHNPENVKPYDRLWAVLSIDTNGNEGLCAVNTPIGPQLAVTGEKRLLDVYLAAVKAGHDEAKVCGKKIVVGTYLRSETKEIYSAQESKDGR